MKCKSLILFFSATLLNCSALSTTLSLHGVPVRCINQAAKTYFVPATLILSVLSAEGGETGLASKNLNGSYDLGNMQINTAWLPMLRRYGYTRSMIQNNPCINVMAGTWILSQAIADGKSYWDGVGDYHSHTQDLNAQYRQKVRSNYYTLMKYLT